MPSSGGGELAGAERVLVAIGRLQDAAAGTPLAPFVAELVAAIAADTTAAELRQELEYVRAERVEEWSREESERQ